jgi:hypothetical protein
MSARVPLPQPDPTPRAAAGADTHRAEGHEAGRRHGNAASAGADKSARDIAHGARLDFGLRLSPEQSSEQQGTVAPWTPRARTVAELRARFQERGRVQSRAMAGNPVDRLGRRLTDFDLDEQEERQRMPEPIPVAWQSPIMPRSPSALSRHAGSALLGLVLGLAVAVPGVLWYKGRIDPVAFAGLSASDLGLAVAAPSAGNAIKVNEPVVVVRRSMVAPVEVARSIEPSAATGERIASAPSESSPQRAAPTPAPPVPPVTVPREETAAAPVVVLKPVPVEVIAPVAPQPPPIKPEVVMLDDARRLIGEGDFQAARRVLQNRVLATTPAARFLLAETYDPNFLAARGIRSVRAEVPRAVELYREALSGGIDAARQRLNGLRP